MSTKPEQKLFQVFFWVACPSQFLELSRNPSVRAVDVKNGLSHVLSQTSSAKKKVTILFQLTIFASPIKMCTLCAPCTWQSSTTRGNRRKIRKTLTIVEKTISQRNSDLSFFSCVQRKHDRTQRGVVTLYASSVFRQPCSASWVRVPKQKLTDSVSLSHKLFSEVVPSDKKTFFLSAVV